MQDRRPKVAVSDTPDLSRRACLVGVSAAVAVGGVTSVLDDASANAAAAGLADLGAIEAVARISRGEISAEQYAAALLERCAAGKALNVFITLQPESVLEAARRCDRERRKGAHSGALFGLPVPVKDCVNTRDYPTTAGTSGLRHFRPAEDAPIVKALRQAGAIVLGKTNMHELGYGWTSNNELFGAVHNPYDPARIPGGSSGGTAAAIAARMAPLGVAEDTNGSIRIPAALCGIVGLRPTTGRYPTQGCVPISPELDQVGPHARTVADLALFDSVAANDWRPLQPQPLHGVRLGVVPDYWFSDLDPEVERITAEALQRLRRAGIEIVPSDFAELSRVHDLITYPVIAHDVGPSIGRYLSEYRAGLDFAQLVSEASPGVRDDLRTVLPGGADFVSDAAYRVIIDQSLPKLRRLYREYFSRTGVAAIVFPATVVPALPIGAEGPVTMGDRRVSLFTALARNITPASTVGIPGLVLPAGLTSSGLPVSIELDAAAGSDRELLRLGMSVAEVLGSLPPPRLA